MGKRWSQLLVFTQAPIQIHPCQPLLHPSPHQALLQNPASCYEPPQNNEKTKNALFYRVLPQDSAAKNATEITKKVEKLGLPGHLFPLSPHQRLCAVSSSKPGGAGCRRREAEVGRTAAAGLAAGKPGTLAPTGRACPEEAGEHRPAFSTANTNAPVLWERGEAAPLNPECRRGHAERSGEHGGTQRCHEGPGQRLEEGGCDAICFLCNAVAAGQLRLACQNPQSWGQSGAESRGRTTHWHCLG